MTRSIFELLRIKRGILPPLIGVLMFLMADGIVSAASGLALAKASGEADALVAVRWREQADALAARGEFGRAVPDWVRSLEVFQRVGNRGAQFGIQLQLISAYHGLGHRREAAAAAEAALALAQGDPARSLAVESARGVVLALSDPDAARVALDHAESLAREMQDSLAEARVANNRGLLLALHDDDAAAVRSWQHCLALLGNRDAVLAAQARVNIAASMVKSADFSAANRSLDAAAQQVAALGSNDTAAMMWVKLGIAGTTLASAEVTNSAAVLRPAAWFERAAALALDDGRLRSLAAGHHGHLLERGGRPMEGLTFTREAVFQAQRVGAAELLYQWEWQSARLQVAVGRRAEALADYRRAVHVVEVNTLRHDLAVFTSQRYGATGFREHLGPLFYEAADLLIRSTEDLSNRATVEARLVEARNTIELLKSAELEDYFQDQCQAVARGKIRDIDSISPATAVIYPIVLADRLELLVSLPGARLERVRVPVGAVELEREVRDLSDSLRIRTSYEFVLPARRLHDWLMRDLDPLLAKLGISTLIFVPDGSLRTIPLGALFDGTNFLASRYTLAVTPGLTLMDPRARSAVSPNVLASGLSEARLGFAALPNVEREVQQVHAIFGGKSLTNQSFTTQRLREEFKGGGYSIVHLATHGRFERDAAKSFILLYDDRLSLDGLERLIRPAQFRGRPVELLTLSACQTAAGDDRAALGLAGVAIKAGARSAMATLWCVHDAAAATLVAEFYAELLRHPTASKARALQLAQLRLMADPNYRHPYYWSPYLMIGNWL